MKAIVLRTHRRPEELKLEEIPRPSAALDKALVRVRVCGVCHLDLILRSGMRARLTLARVLDHELAGESVEIGACVTDFSPGDRVASFNVQACGQCAWCRKGRPPVGMHAATSGKCGTVVTPNLSRCLTRASSEFPRGSPWITPASLPAASGPHTKRSVGSGESARRRLWS